MMIQPGKLRIKLKTMIFYWIYELIQWYLVDVNNSIWDWSIKYGIFHILTGHDFFLPLGEDVHFMVTRRGLSYYWVHLICAMVKTWLAPGPKLPRSGGRWGGPLLIGSCSLLKALLVKCFGMRFFRQVYASVTTKIPAFCPACWCCRWFLPSYFCLVVLTLIMFWCARSSRTWALSSIDVRMTSLFFFLPWMWNPMRRSCANRVVESVICLRAFALGECLDIAMEGVGVLLTPRVPPIWWNWSQTCDRAVLWWILWMVSCDKVFAWLGSFIDDNVDLGHRCSMCTCLPLDSWCHLNWPLPSAWARVCSSLPHL